MPTKLVKNIKLNDDHCLLWVKDPSISPFISRKNILTDEKSMVFEINNSLIFIYNHQVHKFMINY